MMDDIVSERLILRLLPIEALVATAASDSDAAGRILGLSMPDDWHEVAPLARLRLKQLAFDPDYLPWSIRAIVVRETRDVAGYVNFHGPPGRHEFTGTPDTVEFGYTVFAAFRHRGIARETVATLIDWTTQRRVQNFVFSIAPHNADSLAIARHFRAHKTGTQIDETDGPEDVYLTSLDSLRGLLHAPVRR